MSELTPSTFGQDLALAAVTASPRFAGSMEILVRGITERRRARLVRNIAAALREVTQAHPGPVIAALFSKGLWRQDSSYGLYVAGTSDYGRQLLHNLRAAASEA